MSPNKNTAPSLETTNGPEIVLPDIETTAAAAGDIAMRLFLLHQTPALGIDPGALEAIVVTINAGDALRQQAPNN